MKYIDMLFTGLKNKFSDKNIKKIFLIYDLKNNKAIAKVNQSIIEISNSDTKTIKNVLFKGIKIVCEKKGIKNIINYFCVIDMENEKIEIYAEVENNNFLFSLN